MQLRIERYGDIEDLARKRRAWDLDAMSTHERDEFVAWEVTYAPEGKHDLSLCESLERAWRTAFPTVLATMTPQEQSCVLWAHGPMLPDGLLRVFPWMVDECCSSPLYHVETVTYNEPGDGYLYSWASFRFSYENCRQLMQDPQLCLETTRVYVIIARDETLRDVITTPIWEIGPQWLLEHDAVVMMPSSHFEGGYVCGRKQTVEARVADLRSNARRFDYD